MPDLTDEPELLTRLQSGDQPALAVLYDRYRDKLRRMVQVRLDPRLKGRVAPSDVLQEAYIDALKRYPHYFEKADQPFFGWLRLIVAQRLADVHREHLSAKKRDVRNELPFGHPRAGMGSSACLASCIAGTLTSPSNAAVKNEYIAKLETALSELEDVDREILLLRHFEELSNAETAQVLGLHPPAASKRYVRALSRLKQIMEVIEDTAR
ncbi:sigma-70 family RNA polymerase sigma factor [soil metagenome]